MTLAVWKSSDEHNNWIHPIGTSNRYRHYRMPTICSCYTVVHSITIQSCQSAHIKNSRQLHKGLEGSLISSPSPGEYAKAITGYIIFIYLFSYIEGDSLGTSWNTGVHQREPLAGTGCNHCSCIVYQALTTRRLNNVHPPKVYQEFWKGNIISI